MDCSGLGLTEIPADIPQRTTILLITNNEITVIPDFAFDGCTHLHSLDLGVNKLNLTITSLTLSGLVHIERLLLGGNNIIGIADYAFINNTKLQFLDIAYNALVDISEHSLTGLSSLKTLLLANNRIEFDKVHCDAFVDLKQLQLLTMHNNAWANMNIYPDTLLSKLLTVTNLTLDGLPGETIIFGPGFAKMHALEFLYIYGGFQYVSNDTFGVFSNSTVKSLHFRSAELYDTEEMAFSHFSALEILDFTYNPKLGFDNVSRSWYGLQYTDVSTIYLERAVPYDSEIIEMKQSFYDYLNLSDIRKITLDGNNIITMESHFSTTTSGIEYLTYSYNRLMQVLFIMIDMFFCSELKVLDISYQVRRLAPDTTSDAYEEWRKRAKEGIILGKTTKCDPTFIDAFKRCSGIEELGDLPIWPPIQPPTNPPIIPPVDPPIGPGDKQKKTPDGTEPIPDRGAFCIPIPPSLEEFYAAGSLSVDYDTMGEVVLLGDAKVRVFDYSQNGIRRMLGPVYFCPGDPTLLLFVDLSKNNAHEMTREFTMYIGPYVQTLIFSYNDLGDQLSSDVNGLTFSTVPQLENLDLQFNNIKRLPQNVFQAIKMMVYLDLGSNALRLLALNFTHHHNLSYLGLAENLLTSLSPDTCEDLDSLAASRDFTVDLSGNPLECSCLTITFMEWMLATHVIFDKWDDYFCLYYQSLVLMDRAGIEEILANLYIDCNNKTWLIVVSVCCVLLTLIIAVSIIVYRHRWEVTYCCNRFVVRRKKYQQFEKHQDESWRYDAFIAHDKADTAFVKNVLVPALESPDKTGDRLKLCIHQRDFDIGVNIQESIMEAVCQSRKTLLVISRKFLVSSWCEFETEIASMHCFDQGRDLIVSIRMEDLPTETMSRVLKNLLRRYTYIDYPQTVSDNCEEMNDFWQKLRSALERPPRYITHCACGRIVEPEDTLSSIL